MPLVPSFVPPFNLDFLSFLTSSHAVASCFTLVVFLWDLLSEANSNHFLLCCSCDTAKWILRPIWKHCWICKPGSTWDIGEMSVSLQVADLLVAMCKAALHSSRKSIIFEPYPSIVDPLDPQTLAFSPKVSASLVSSDQVCSLGFAFFSLWNIVWQVQNYERLQQALDNILLIKSTGQVPFCIIYSLINGRLGNYRACPSNCCGWLIFFFFIQGPFSEIKKEMDKKDPLAHPLLMWWVALPCLHNGANQPLFLKLSFCVCTGFYPATNHTLSSFHSTR